MSYRIENAFIGNYKDESKVSRLCTLVRDMDDESTREFIGYHGNRSRYVLSVIDEDYFIYLSGYHSNNTHIAIENDTGIIVGIILTQIEEDPRSLKIDKLYVDPEYRNEGIGRQLYHETRKKLDPDNKLPVILNVARHNKSAIKFYESLGFRTMAQKMFLI